MALTPQMVISEALLCLLKGLPVVGTVAEFADGLSHRCELATLRNEVTQIKDGRHDHAEKAMLRALVNLSRPRLSGADLKAEFHNLGQIRSQGWQLMLFEGLFLNSSHWAELHSNPQIYGRVLLPSDQFNPNDFLLPIDADGKRILELPLASLSLLLEKQATGIPKARLISSQDIWAFPAPRLWSWPWSPRPKLGTGTMPVGEIWRFSGHEDPVTSVAFSAGGRRVLSSSRSSAIRSCNVEDGRELRRFSPPADVAPRDFFDAVSADLATNPNVVFSFDGRSALSLSSRGDFHWVLLWDLESGREPRRLEGHSGKINCSAFSGDGRRAFSSSVDSTIRTWDVKTGRELRRLDCHAYSLACSPDGRDAISCGQNGMLLWDLDTGRKLRQFEGHLHGVPSLAFFPTGRRALSGCGFGIKTWDVMTGRQLHHFNGSAGGPGRVHCVAVSRDGRRVLSGGNDGTVRLWCGESGSELNRFDGHAGAVRSVSFSPDGRRALSGGDDKTVRLWGLPQ